MKGYNRTGLLLAGIILVVLATMLVSVQPVMSTEDLNPTTATVIVNVIIDVTLNNAPITFSSISSGANADATNAPMNVTIEITTNVATNLSVNGSATFDHDSLGFNFTIGNLTYTNQSGGNYVAMTTAYADGGFLDWQTIAMPTTVEINRSVYTNLAIPSGQESGSYTASVSVRLQDE